MNVELFCCAGGMAEGFRRAGIQFDVAVDSDPDACDSYERNLWHRPLQIDVRDLIAKGGLKRGDVNLLVADPPCSPWSRAGKRRGLEDDRDMLQETIAVMDELRPHVWLLANIPGLDDAPAWRGVVQPLIGGFALRGGYCVDYAKIDSADHGVPQRRVRPFWFGHERGTACICWPVPTHGDPKKLGRMLDDRKPWVTCRQALGHLPPEELGRPVILRPKYGNGKYWSELGSLALNILANESASGGHWLSLQPQHPCGVRSWRMPDGKAGGDNSRASTIDEPAKVITVGGRAHGGILVVGDGGSKHPPSMPDRPAMTIATNSARAQNGGGVLVWPWDRAATPAGSGRMRPNAVILSERARAILQGFPDPGAPGGWIFCGKTKKARSSQVGQATPPAMAEAVARAMRGR